MARGTQGASSKGSRGRGTGRGQSTSMKLDNNANQCKRTRARNPTVAQKEAMLQYMEKHKSFATGRVNAANATNLFNLMVKRMGDKVNEVADGPIREPSKWFKTWIDWRNKAKDFAATSHRPKNLATGGGGPEDDISFTSEMGEDDVQKLQINEELTSGNDHVDRIMAITGWDLALGTGLPDDLQSCGEEGEGFHMKKHGDSTSRKRHPLAQLAGANSEGSAVGRRNEVNKNDELKDSTRGRYESSGNGRNYADSYKENDAWDVISVHDSDSSGDSHDLKLTFGSKRKSSLDGEVSSKLHSNGSFRSVNSGNSNKTASRSSIASFEVLEGNENHGHSSRGSPLSAGSFSSASGLRTAVPDQSKDKQLKQRRPSSSSSESSNDSIFDAPRNSPTLTSTPHGKTSKMEMECSSRNGASVLFSQKHDYASTGTQTVFINEQLGKSDGGTVVLQDFLDASRRTAECLEKNTVAINKLLQFLSSNVSTIVVAGKCEAIPQEQQPIAEASTQSSSTPGISSSAERVISYDMPDLDHLLQGDTVADFGHKNLDDLFREAGL